MADPRFFRNQGPLSLGELAQIAGAELGDSAREDAVFVDVAPIEDAGPRHVSFIDNRRYVQRFEASRAGACVVEPGLASRAPAGMMLLLADKPYRAYANIARAFYPEVDDTASRPVGGIHTAAHVDADAEIGSGCEVGAGAVIGPKTIIGENTRVEAGAVVGAGVVVGEDSRIGANATLTHCVVGRRANIHPGVRIGQRGFGFDMDASGHLDVPQLGRVLIGDDVEIGANSTIDRGAGPDTVISDGCKIDNLVQIGHNVTLGRGCVVVAHAAVSGSVRLEDYVVLAGQVGIGGHLTIGAGAQIGAQAGVMRDVPPGAKVVGSPAVPVREFFRGVAVLAKLARPQG